MRFFNLTILLFCCLGTVIAQRHTKCDSGIEILLGGSRFAHFSNGGFVGSINYVKYFSDRLTAKIGGLYATEKDRNLKHNVIAGNLSAGYNFMRFGETGYLNFILGATYGIENTPDKSNYDLSKYGVLAGLEYEHYFNDKLSLIVNAQERYMLGENKKTIYNDVIWGNVRWYIQAGVRFHFYNGSCNQPNFIQRSR